jgi:predicted acyltransferase
VWRRAALLFAFGLLLNAMEGPIPPSWSTFRFPGVLQRIALVYLAVAWLTERTSVRTQVTTAVAALFGYWGLMMLVPVPGAGAGVLTQGGNLASFIDRRILGHHMAHATWDPEGLLSTIPAIVTALAGVFAGEVLSEPDDRTFALWAAGLAAMLAGLLWDRVFPINKNLWTSSFTLFTAGLAIQVLACFHWILDIHHSRWWAAPFLAFGRNPLPGYFLSVGVDSLLNKWPVAGQDSMKAAIFHLTFARWLTPCCGAEAASLAYAVAYVALWAVVLSGMYRRAIFLGV